MADTLPHPQGKGRARGGRVRPGRAAAALRAALCAGRGREYAAVLAFFFLLSVFFTWPLILHVHDGVVGSRNDTLLNTWIVTWDARTIFTRPWGLFQGNIIYPSRDVLAYSEHLFALGVLAAPVYHLTGNPVLAYNFLLFLAMVLSAFGCYLLVREWGGSRAGGLIAGAYFSFATYRITKMGHLHVYFSAFLPFMLLYEHRYLERGGRKNLLLFGVFLLAQSLASWHYLAFCFFAAGVMWVWRAVFARRREEWRRMALLVAACALVLLCVLPFALPYLRAHARLPGFERGTREAEAMYSVNLRDLLVVTHHSVLYGGAPGPLTITETERVCFPGLAVPLLALAALVLLFLRRQRGGEGEGGEELASRRKAALYFLILAASAFLVAMGPQVMGVKNPFYYLLYGLGVMRFIRVPARFYTLVVLGLGVLAGFGAGEIASRVSAHRAGSSRAVARGAGPWAGKALPLLVTALVLVDLASTNMYVFRVPVKGEVPEVCSWLREQGDVAVIELPTSPLGGLNRYDRDNDLAFTDVREYHDREAQAMYLSTYHWKKIVNGYSGYFPYFYRRVMMEMQGFPSQRCVELLRGLGVDFVLWNWEWAPPQRREEYAARLREQPGLEEVTAFGSHTVYRVQRGPLAGWEDLEVEAALPAEVRAGEGFALGIVARNRGEAPLVKAEEDPQRALLTVRDGAGREVLREELTYWAPFFLQAGEGACLPLYVEKAPPPGSYRMELSLRGGVLGERLFAHDLEVTDVSDSVNPANLDGAVSYAGRERMELDTRDGLLPLDFTVVNMGDTLWRAAWKNKEDELLCPNGLVHVAVRWERDGDKVWEEQRCTLPCDVAPGQSVAVPTLVRTPPQTGDYRVFIGLSCEGYGWFGGVLELEVTVR